MTNKLTNLSLAAILGLGACAGSGHNFRPWAPFFNGESNVVAVEPVKGSDAGQTGQKSLYGPNSNILYSRNNDYGSPNSMNRDLDNSSVHQANFDSYITGLPVQIADNSTSVDLGIARLAPSSSGELVLLRPIYSHTYKISLDNGINLRRYQDNTTDSFPNPIYFQHQDSFMTFDDDPQRVEREEGVVISSLLKWVWGWDVFSPIRNTANGVRDYSDGVVKDTLGSNSNVDFTGRRVILGYNIPISDRFYLEVQGWADMADIDQSGIAIQMSLPFGTNR
ncbi:hypothetical protein FJZ21_02010 [Candidatus Pacearchaeota archaeon]|nr:hypothetical protein [Candidatus Pacearchaeota archaeon]